jgi:hypothetical protein
MGFRTTDLHMLLRGSFQNSRTLDRESQAQTLFTGGYNNRKIKEDTVLRENN